MEESILTSIKKLLGISGDDTSFDLDIIIAINSSLSVLTQIGIGPREGLRITDASTKWVSFLPDEPKWSLVKDYIYMKSRLLFDPPTNATLIQSLKDSIAEAEYRLKIESETSL